MKNLAFVILAILAINVSFAGEVGEMSSDPQKCVRSAQDGRKADVPVVATDEESKKGSSTK